MIIFVYSNSFYDLYIFSLYIILNLFLSISSVAYGSADDDSVSSNTQSTVLNDLKDLIQVVYSCLDQYQGMQSTEIKNAATELMKTFQS